MNLDQVEKALGKRVVITSISGGQYKGTAIYLLLPVNEPDMPNGGLLVKETVDNFRTKGGALIDFPCEEIASIEIINEP